MKTCFATVIYKQAQPYLEDFLKSINEQTDKDFELLLFNDNYTAEELDGIHKRIKKLDVLCRILDLSGMHLSIAGNRIEMLGCVKDLGFDLAILGDADDTFSLNRVELYKKAAELDKTSVFFYNKLVTDKNSDVFKNIPETTHSIKQIAQSNYLGMSTSAIRVRELSDEFLDSLKEGQTPAFDWYLFTRILMDIGGGRLVEDAKTIYRIYDNNTVGTTRNITQEYSVKKTHYECLAERYDYFRYLLENLNQINLDKIEPNQDHQGYWWSDIQLEDSYEI